MPVLKKSTGPSDKAEERFCLLLILRQMATGGDSENQYLSHLYEFLAVVVEHEDCLFAFSSQSCVAEGMFEMMTEDLRRTPQQVRLQLYGSSAEDLHTDVFPDLDVMIFPTADELMIDDELIEYCFPSNPLPTARQNQRNRSPRFAVLSYGKHGVRSDFSVKEFPSSDFWSRKHHQ